MRIWGPCTAPRHGNIFAYQRFGCRCEHVRERVNAQKRDYRVRVRERCGRVARPPWDFDRVNAEAAIAGRWIEPLTNIERWYAIDVLDRYGLSASEIATRLRINIRTVVRRRAERRRVVYVLAS